MSSNKLSTQLKASILKHLDTLQGTYCWEKVQQEAYLHFQQIGLPDNKSEVYKYTPITSILTDKFDFSSVAKESIHSAMIDTYLASAILPKSLEVYAIVLINGKLSDMHSAETLDQSYFQVTSLRKASLKHSTLFKKYFEKYVSSQLDIFIAVNTALLEDGVGIYIPDNVVLDKPLCIYNLIDNTTPGAAVHPRIFVHVGSNSSVSILNQVVNLGDSASFTNTVMDIVVEAYAQVDHYSLQIEIGNSYQLNTTNCYQASHSVTNNYTFTWDGPFIRNNLYVRIQDSDAIANMYGLYCLGKHQHVDNHTTVDHQEPNTQSNELYKGIIAGSATGVFNGRIYVQADAQKTNAFQANNNILLSDEATIHTKPQLEIWADDVKCSHGATVGQLDEAQIFYLQARGISEKTARHMLLYAFMNEVLDKVSMPTLREYLKESCKEHLDLLG